MKTKLKYLADAVLTLILIASFSLSVFAKGEGTVLSVYAGKAEAGKEMTVTVRVDNNEGFANGLIKIAFDDTVLKYKSYYDESLMSEAMTQAGGKENNSVKYAFVSLNNIKEDGEMFTLTFDVLPETEMKSSDIIITVEELVDGDTEEPLNVKTVNTTVTVEEKPKFIKGDVDGNGQITLNDAMAIILHVAKKEDLTEEMLPPADVNEDGLISLNDAMAIILHVAKKEEIKVLP